LNQPRRFNAADSDASADRARRLWAVGAGVFLVIAVFLFGGWVARLVAVIVVGCTLQGLWRGAAELTALLVGMVLAVVLAPPVGGALEGIVASIAGTSGLVNRFASMGVAALLIVIITAGVGGVLARRWLKQRPHLARLDRYLGAVAGLGEGAFLSMLALWVPLALEPIAESRTTTMVETETDGVYGLEEVPNPVAAGVVDFARAVRGSSLGAVAESTNPIHGSRILSLLDDFVAVSQDREAMEYFLATPVMREINDLPSIAQAIEMLKADAELSALFSERGATADSVRAVLSSETVVRIFDETTVVDDLAPRIEDIAAAITEAKGRIGPR
jgi:hypothetical protein